jgi:purine nucleoside phosphorylase
MSSRYEGGKKRPTIGTGLRPGDIAKRNMDVEFQTEVLQQENDIFYKNLVETKDFLQKRIKQRTNKDTLDGWIVCGSGLASLPNSADIKIIDRISVDEIPNWFSPQAPGHGKEVIIANIKGQLVGIQTGRAHIYDTNYSPEQLKMISAPLIVAKGLGVNWVVTTNAAGVLDNGKVKKGDVIVDIDYVNKHGVNPMMGPNDPRLGQRFPGKADVADPDLFTLLEKSIPYENLHLGIYTLSSNAPFYEGRGDIIEGMYKELREQNEELVEAFGMSFAMDAMVMQHFNHPPIDKNGFDRKVKWIGLTAATNIIPQVQAPTKYMLSMAALTNPNPTSHKEVLEGGVVAEKLLIPGVIKLCESITNNPLPKTPYQNFLF